MAADFSSSGSASGYSSDESDGGAGRRASLFCAAITNLTEDIVSVLGDEVGFINAARAKGLITEHSYREFLKQESTNRAERLLLKIKRKIKRSESRDTYENFLLIFREEKATEDLADKIEKKVKELEKEQKSTGKVKRLKKGRGGGRDHGIPKLAVPNDVYSSGIVSDASLSQTGDPVLPLKSVGGATPIISGAQTSGFEPSHTDSAEIIATSPHQATCTGLPAPVSVSANDHSNSSLPVYPSAQKLISEVFDRIRRDVESGRTKVERVIADKDYAISLWLQQLQTVNQKLEEDIAKKKKDFDRLESQMKGYEKYVKELGEQREKDQEKIKELEQKLKEKEGELLADIQQIESLKEARDCKIEELTLKDSELDKERQKTQELEEQKNEADMKLVVLQLESLKEIAGIKERMQKLIHEAEKDAQKEKADREKAELKAQLDVQRVQLDVKQAQLDAQLQTKLETQLQIHEAKSQSVLQGLARKMSGEAWNSNASDLTLAEDLDREEKLTVQIFTEMRITRATSSNSSQRTGNNIAGAYSSNSSRPIGNYQQAPSEDSEK